MAAYLKSTKNDIYIVLDKAVTFIGRHPECDVVLEDSRKISRKHCCIAQVNDTFVIRDLGSMNGIRVNGTRIKKESRLKLKDEVTIGDCSYILTAGKPKVKKANGKDEKSRERSRRVEAAQSSDDSHVSQVAMEDSDEIFLDNSDDEGDLSAIPLAGMEDQEDSIDFDIPSEEGSTADSDEFLPVDDDSQIGLMPE